MKRWFYHLACMCSGQMAFLMSVAALERGQSEWWITVVFAIMIPISLFTFFGALVQLFGRVPFCSDRR